jgi:hypothetical protein
MISYECTTWSVNAKEENRLRLFENWVLRINSQFVYLKKRTRTFMICTLYLTLVGWGSSVSTVSDYGLKDRGSIPDRGRGFFL